MTRIAFIDESQRQGFYALAAIAVPHANVAKARREIRRLAPRQVVRRHFVKESNQVRKEMLATFAALPAASYACLTTASLPVVEQRALLLRTLVIDLVAGGLDRLLLDHVDDAQQRRDRQVLAHALRGIDVAYDFGPPHTSEPMLWAPDAIAWCAGRRDWRPQLDGWVMTRTVS